MHPVTRSCATLALALLSACARGSEASGVDRDFDLATADGGLDDAASGDDGSYVSEAPTPGAMAAADQPSSEGEPTADPLGNGSSGNGTTDSSGDVKIEAMCEAVESCFQSRRIGELAGDKSGAPVVATGTRSEWLSVRVREDSNAARGLNVVLKLRSEGNADYDLLVYRAGGSSGMTCTGESEASAVPGPAPEEVKMSWGDTYIFSDDSRTLSVEVRHVGGDCKPWVLEVFRP